MQDIVFTVTPCAETKGFVAIWDAPNETGGIATQGETLDDLKMMIADAAQGWFERDVSFRLVIAP